MNGGGVKLSANCPDDCPKIWTWEKMLSSVSFWSELPVKVRHISGAAMPHASGQRFLALMSTYFIEY